MIILALDQSKKCTGFAVILAYRRSAKVLQSGWFAGGSADERATVDWFRHEVKNLILDHRPGLVVWERPSTFIGKGAGGGGLHQAALILLRLDEALHGLCGDMGVPCDRVAATTWRAKVLGKGNGKLGRKEAKAAAINYAAMLGRAVRNDDEAEAICIGLWAAAYSPVLARLEAA